MFYAETILVIERRGGLIHQDHLWLCEEGPSDAHALCLTPREVISNAIKYRGLEPHPFERSGQFLVTRKRSANLEILPHRPGEWDRPLEDHSDSAAQFAGVNRCAVLAPEPNAARRWDVKTVAEPQQRRFPRP